MSWHYSRALAAEFLGADYSDSELSALLKSNPIAEKSSSKGKTKGTLTHSPFGMTFKHLTDPRGVELLTWYQAASRARTSALPVPVQASTVTSQGSGPKWQESLAKYDPDSRTWKTRQRSLLGGLTEYSATFPKWGTMQSGELFLLPIPELPIYENESGYLHTPTATANQMAPSMVKKGSGYLPTPTANGWRSEGALESLRRQVDAGTMTRAQAEAMAGGTLTPERMKKWPTPRASQGGPDFNNKNRGAGGDSLATAVAKFPTPCASDNRDRGNRSTPAIKRRIKAGKQVMLSDVSGQLNPTWEEWLMGWPMGWTDAQPLATARFQEWLQQHGNC